MANKPVHAVLSADEYDALLRASRERGVHTSEIIREATIAWVRSNLPESDGLVSILEVEAQTPHGESAPRSRFMPDRAQFFRPPAPPQAKL